MCERASKLSQTSRILPRLHAPPVLKFLDPPLGVTVIYLKYMYTRLFLYSDFVIQTRIHVTRHKTTFRIDNL